MDDIDILPPLSTKIQMVDESPFTKLEPEDNRQSPYIKLEPEDNRQSPYIKVEPEDNRQSSYIKVEPEDNRQSSYIREDQEEMDDSEYYDEYDTETDFEEMTDDTLDFAENLSVPTQSMPNTDVASQNNMGTQMNQENWSHQVNQSGYNSVAYAPTQAMPNTDVASQNNMGTQMNQENWSHQANQSGYNQGMYGIPAKSETTIINEGCEQDEILSEDRRNCQLFLLKRNTKTQRKKR